MNDQYAELYSSYQWLVPSQFNIAQACAHRWADNPLDGRRVAVFHENEQGQRDVWTYSRLSETAGRLANGLLKMGVQPGDRVALIMSQRPEYVVACMAVLSVGAVALPLPAFSEPGHIVSCLRDAMPRVGVVDEITGPGVLAAQNKYPFMNQVIALNLEHEAAIPWRTLLARQPAAFKPMPTLSHAPALLLYEPAGTPSPRGKLLPHRSLIGNLPGFVAAQNWFPVKNDVFWTPNSWQHGDGLMFGLLPALYFGHPIVNAPGRFSAERAFDLIARHQVTNCYLTGAQVNALATAGLDPSVSSPGRARLRALSVGGEPLDQDATAWCAEHLGVAPNLFYGQARTGMIIGNSYLKWPAKPSSLGRPYPGHRVALLDKYGTPCPVGVVGEIVVNQHDVHGDIDPALFLGYWQKDLGQAVLPNENWQQTGELAVIDQDGYYWYQGRKGA
ncbi:MAG: AMP-binding protein [Candidimonas sp.]